MSRALPARVRITEVGPRDGLQNEPQRVPTATKAAFVRALVAAGLTEIEITSFVRPDRVPQLADAEELCAALGPPPAGVRYVALVPNERGLERALATGVIGKVAVFTAASETFAQRNVNASIDESIARFRPVVEGARAAGLALRGYVSAAMGCPYEGHVDAAHVVAVVEALDALGCEDISIGDTIGAGTPGDVARVLDAVLAVVPAERIALHFHDTRGMAVANVLEGLRRGIASYDASAGGLGGCPYAPGAAGNLATEDLVYLLDGLGVAHGVGLDPLRQASASIENAVGHALVGRVYRAPAWPLGE
ncbi:MAG: hydroxymethylglutaryl-CoA lyase [Planctomycetota bacterium]|nr:hydroxymethylglutaryl-CoA lyase [Planctomycetota bacterium]